MKLTGPGGKYTRALLAPLLLALLRPPAAAQVFLGAELGPDAFIRSEEAAIDTLAEESFAWALSVEVSSGVLYSVFKSTAPEEEMIKYLRLGIYRQELAAMLLLSAEKDVPFTRLAVELPKAGGFSGLAARYKADAMALFAAGGRLKLAAEKMAPLFLTGSGAEPSAPEPKPGEGQ